MFDLTAYMKQGKMQVEKQLHCYLNFTDETLAQIKIHEAMAYSLFAGGKRLRPILCFAAAEAAGGNVAQVLPAACALEVLHTYSLIHDDLPCMDDDDYRRGRLTSHKVFGENLAVLAGDALLTFVFEILSRELKEQEPRVVLQVVKVIAQAAGSQGMVGGQVMDLLSEHHGLTLKELQLLHQKKTGALIAASLEIGALLAGATSEVTLALCNYGKAFGLAFQITDDILDVTGDIKQMGKRPGGDQKQEKATYTTMFGLEKAKVLAKQAVEQANASLEGLPGNKEPLLALANYLTQRSLKMTNYLEQINSPEDIKRLNCKELNALSAEIRTYLLDVISQNGGHLASNLGTVELTLALHKVLDTTKDRLIWDVGHQSYVHKIITGRRVSFKTLRQEGGLSGFPKRAESIHDAYDTGHSSTSIAAALGFAKARDLKKEDHQVVAVIGDGSMTGGEAFEALNLAASLHTNILVILNDNHMSIARNIGGMADYLNRLRSSAIYNKSKKGVRYFVGKIPCVGKSLVKGLERIKESVKYLIIPGMVFNELGFNYYGPVDGHDIKGLIEILKKLKYIKGPILLHVLTRKGKGYLPAQKDAATFHGVGPFEVESGRTIAGDSKIPSYTKVFSDAIVDMASQDHKILGITAAMADGTGLDHFAKLYPDRFFDVGIAEQTAVTLGAALALDGFRPVVAIYSSFLQRAFDQLIQDVALQKAPVIFAIDRAGLVGEDGPTHHGAFDISYLRLIPNLALMVPRDEKGLQDMLWTALHHNTGPVAIRYPRGKAQGVSMENGPEILGWGKGEVLREGKDAVILSIGPLTYTALASAEAMLSEGYQVGVVDARFVKPLDDSLIQALAQQYPLIVTLEDNSLAGGFGAAVLELLATNKQTPAKIFNLGLPDRFVIHGNQAALHKDLGLDVAGVTQCLLEQLRVIDHE